MRIAITGAYGQLGTALQNSLAGDELTGLDLPEFDISDTGFADALARMQPELVIHSAAMTNVDACARDPEMARRINVTGTEHVARACRDCGAGMVYVSTNEVFDGTADRPYREDDPTHAINPYAQSKLAGEEAARRLVDNLYITRTAWVFSPGGNNFPAKIMRAADKMGSLRVVTDEVANPTYAPDLADAIAGLVRTGSFGIYHLTNQGICSRYEFTVEILKQSGREDVPVEPITSEQFTRDSKVPPYVPLENTRASKLGIELRDWPSALKDYLAAP